jgi:hypothetical protein
VPDRAAAAMADNTNQKEEQTMTIYESLMKAVQDDARRAGERNRLLLEARRARRASRQRPVPPGAGDTFLADSYRAILARLDCRTWLSVGRPERRI